MFLVELQKHWKQMTCKHLWFFDVNRNQEKDVPLELVHWEICSCCQQKRQVLNEGKYCDCVGLPYTL